MRRIADVVDKYKIPTVKLTGGQRVDLFGVMKQDLPAVWRDLGMPSGHAYAKALRTVKTCVGSEWCRFGVQDSTNMGIALERDLWRMYAPHKVKLAVFRNAEDEVFALADKCPHKGGPLSQGIVFGRKVACPLHNWNMQLEDGCAAAPDVGCSKRYAVKVEAGDVFLPM